MSRLDPLRNLRAKVVFTRADLPMHSVSSASVTRAARTPRLTRVHRGVFINEDTLAMLGGDAELNRWRCLLLCHLLRGGPHSVVSHRAAARLYRLDGVTGLPVDVTVPPNSAFRRRPAWRAELSEHDIATHDGFPITSLGRTIVDLARVVDHEVLEQALESALRGPDTRVPDVWNQELLAELRKRAIRAQGVGSQNLRALLSRRADEDRPTGSFAETVFAQALRADGQQLTCQPEVRFLNRRGAIVKKYFPDFKLLAYPVFVEVDGRVGHADEEQRARDAERDRLLGQIGRVLRFPAKGVLANRSRAVADVRANLAGLPRHPGSWETGRWQVSVTGQLVIARPLAG